MTRRDLTPSERRALVRRLHPDVGGDTDQFVRVLAAVDRLSSEDHLGSRVRSASTDRLGGGRWTRRRRRTIARVRAALPRRMPGARRYAHL